MTIVKRLGMTLAGAAAMLLAACDQQTPRVVEMFISENGTHRFLADAAQKGPIHLQLLPDAIASASGYADIALGIFNDAAAQRSKRIFTLSADEARSAVRVLILIGAGEGASGSSLCGGSRPAATLGEKETKIVAVLCGPQGRLAEVHGWVRKETAAQDEEYRLIMVDLAKALFQRRQQGK